MAHEKFMEAGHPGVWVRHRVVSSVADHALTSHTEQALSLVVSGRMRLWHGAEISAEAGSLVVVPAGVPHRPCQGPMLELWMLGFCPSCVGLTEAHRLMRAFRRVRLGALPVLFFPAERRQRIVLRLRELQAECARQTPEGPELVRSLLVLLLGEVHRALPSDDPITPGESLVSSALEFIQEHCLQPISLKAVAAALFRTPSHVAASIKASTGYTVGEWIIAGRVAEAARRLAHTDASLDDIAASVGWRDKTHFIRQFRKAYGSTPAAWRRERRSG